jgi:stearoyl-CoA desaturase (delta-9 desaturase)
MSTAPARPHVLSLARRTERAIAVATIGIPAAATLAALAWAAVRGLHALDLALCAAFYVATVLGVTVGYHRLATHRAFEARPALRGLLAALGSMAAQGPLLFWAACHRRHHATSDADDDPHSPRPQGTGWAAPLRGFFWGHVGWMLDHEPEPWDRYAKDLLRDPLLFRIHVAYPYWVAAGLLLPALIGGIVGGSWERALGGALWGGFVRIFLVQHATWSVNSIGHLWGGRRFDTRDSSRNNALCGLVALGEGWHNNHHAFPRSARHGLARWEIDVSYLVIRAAAALRLAHDVQTPTDAQVREALAHKVA